MTDHAADQRRYVARHKEEELYKQRRKRNGELYRQRHPEKVKKYKREYDKKHPKNTGVRIPPTISLS